MVLGGRQSGRGWATLAAAALALLLAGCGNDKPAPPTPPELLITTESLTGATLGVDYNETLAATGGTPPLSWKISTGGLPTGLELEASTGILSGIPEQIGEFTVDFQVSDTASPKQTATKSFTLIVIEDRLNSSERVSLTDPGGESDRESGDAAASADGRFVVFSSLASNLVVGDTNGQQDIFLRDTCLGAAAACTPTTVRVSVADDGSEGNGQSAQAAVGATGRFIVFTSLASNLVAGDANLTWDVFLRDTCLGAAAACTPATLLVSATAAGSAGNGASVQPAISADGRYVAFRSLANDLVGGDANGASDIFVRDTCAGQDPAGCTPSTVRASLNSKGQEGNGESQAPALSSNGRFVAFESLASNLVGNDSDLLNDIFLRDTCLGAAAGCTPTTVEVSLTENNVQANGHSFLPSLSGDGRFVAFESLASNLAADDTNSIVDVFLRDTCVGAAAGCVPTTTLLSVDSNGDALGGPNSEPSLSADGRFVVFRSKPALPTGPNSPSEILAHDTCLGQDPMVCTPQTARVSLGFDGTRVNADCLRPGIAPLAPRAVFQSAATNLVANDTNQQPDVFRAEIVF